MSPSSPCPRPPKRDSERGAALAITLIAITALLGLGALTVLSVQTEISAGGQSRFSQSAVYAAESGAAAGMDFLRLNCNTQTLFGAWVTPGNVNPLSPAAIVGNQKRPGEDGNPFTPDLDLWYSVEILNNADDPLLATGGDFDAIVVLRSTGRGPDQTVAVVEMQVLARACLAKFCETEYAQRGVTSRNDAFAACSTRIQQGTGLRTITPTVP